MTATHPLVGRDAPNRAFVDLTAIERNVRLLRAASHAPEFMAVVKADGYGHGAVQAAQAALRGGATQLGVYSVQEATALREAGLSQPILSFRPALSGESSLFVTGGIMPTLLDPEVGAEISATAGNRKVAFHVKIDTGLNRSGIEPNEVLPLLRRLAVHPNLHFLG